MRRLMRESGLLTAARTGSPRGPHNRDGTIIPKTVDTMWGTDMTLGRHRSGITCAFKTRLRGHRRSGTGGLDAPDWSGTGRRAVVPGADQGLRPVWRKACQDRLNRCRPEAGRRLPGETLRVPRTITTRRAQTVEMRKQLLAQIGARTRQGVAADLEAMDEDLRAMLEAQIRELEQRIAGILAQNNIVAAKAELLRSIPRIGPVSAAMLLAEMPELGRMTAREAASMTGLAPVPRDSGLLRGRRLIAGGRRAL